MSAIAIRARGRRCVACNQPATAWLCQGCAQCSGYEAARTRDPRSPSAVGHARYVAASTEREVVDDHTWNDPRNTPAHWSTAAPAFSDPHRWCDECLAHIKHRRECPLIAVDGVYVGSIEPVRKFGKLRSIKDTWTSTQLRVHRLAVRRRWDAFCALWSRITLTFAAEAFTAAAQLEHKKNEGAFYGIHRR